MNNLFSVLESGGGDGMNLCQIIRHSIEEKTVTMVNGTVSFAVY